MLGWIFKKKNKKDTGAVATAAGTTSPVAQAPVPSIDWSAALARARGDDEALRALARSAGAPLQIKQAAIEALDAEAALKQAEREFRSHDRRIHQLAKQRLQAKVAQRQTRAQAARLLDDARSLAGMAELPANRVVEIDRAWQLLDAGAIEPALHDDFSALTARLAAQLRQRADSEGQRKRWQADAAAALRQLQAACTAAATGTQDRQQLAAATSAARSAASALPPDGAADSATQRAQAGLLQAIHIADTLDSHLAVLDRLLAEPAAQQDGQTLAPLADAPLAALLQTRLARWQQACDQARQAQRSQHREQVREQQRARLGEQLVALADGVAQAESALDAGQLADAHQLLGATDAQLQGADAPVALQTRIAAAQARLAQLRGWQHWAGGRARDELVLQAEALAAATVGSGDGKVDLDGDVTAQVARLSIRQRADVIQTLRQRWKEIDGQGGGGTHALWRRFDAALTAAGEPVAAHIAAQRAAREANLAARRQLLDVLEAVDAVTAPESSTESPAPAPGDTRRLATAIDRFHVEWRKLGPLEHTVPRAAQAALVERLDAALRRLEAPLRAARAQARAERQQLVTRAQALVGDGPGRARDLVGEVRALQAEWQLHARSLPLARDDEQTLWTDFKAATDAAFAERNAVYSARDAEFEAHAAERAALIERLRPRPEDSLAVQRRTLAEVDVAWPRCGPAPRGRAAALEAEFRAARDVLQRWLDDSAQRTWQASCDALDAKLALCLARETEAGDGAAVDAAASAASWSALPVLPAPLEDALRRRAGLTPTAATATAPDIDELLLQIEAAWELPTPPAFEAVRRQRKLLAMKLSLEGRRSAAPEALAPVAMLALLLARADLDAGQRDRLAAVLAAWRRRGPGRL